MILIPRQNKVILQVVEKKEKSESVLLMPKKDESNVEICEVIYASEITNFFTDDTALKNGDQVMVSKEKLNKMFAHQKENYFITSIDNILGKVEN